MDEFIAYLQRDAEEHLKYRSQSILKQIENQMKILDAKDYILPRRSLEDVARITDQKPYNIIFIREDGRAVIISMRTLIDCDEAEVVEKRTYGMLRVSEDQVRKQTIKDKANDWWHQYSEKLLSEIEATGGKQNVILDKAYRLPCMEVKPYLDELLRKETDDQFGFDNIDEDLNGMVIPLVSEIEIEEPLDEPPTSAPKTQPKSRKEKFAERQAKAV